MSKNIEGKKQIVEEIKEKINASKSVVLADYNKLTVLEVTALRNKFRAANCEYKVYKNTLVRKAFNELGVTDFDNDLNGTTATVFCADETSGASIFAKAVKENPALAEECVHERGLAVVNVSNDGDITKLFVTNEIFQESILMEIGRTRPEGQAGKRGASTMTESVSVHRFALLRKRL